MEYEIKISDDEKIIIEDGEYIDGEPSLSIRFHEYFFSDDEWHIQKSISLTEDHLSLILKALKARVMK